MRNPCIRSIAVLVFAILVCWTTAFAQRGQRAGGNAAVPGPPHDPHDLSGIWLSQGGGGGGGTLTQWKKEAPPSLTPDGLATMKANIPAKGPKGVVPARANDPIGDANPPGLLRTLLYNRPFEFVPRQDKVMQIFEWTNHWRQIWTDGRKVPTPEDTGPYWYGYSVARWEGDTFVVETVGLDSREWLDDWGVPYSDSLRLQERWHRLDRDNLELTIRVDDPKTFTQPWVSDKKMYRLQPKDSPDGELLEVIFAPMDEKVFNENIRNPAAGVVKK